MTPHPVRIRESASSRARLPRLAVAGVLALAGLAAQAGSPPAVSSYQDLASLPAGFGEDAVYWPLVEGSGGLAYGDINFSREFRSGLVFRFEADGTRTVVSTAVRPATALARGSDGLLYFANGGAGTDLGSIARVTADGQVETVHAFSATADQGLGNPHAALVPDGSGGWYGVGYVGAVETLFQLDASGAVTLLDKFAGPDKGKYVQNMARTRGGELVGVTLWSPGRATENDALFVYKPGGHVRMIHDFGVDTGDGYSSRGPLAVGADGAVYGTTFYGGTHGNGTAWRVDNGANYRIVRQYDLNDGDPFGGEPVGFTSNADGLLYGATNLGGPKMGGTVYTMNRTGETHRLHSFEYRSPFTQPYSPLAAPGWFSDGSLHGMTSEGGAFNGGNLYRIGLE